MNIDNNKIEVGEYVRTKKGQIDKFEKLLGYEDDKETSIVVCKEKKFWLEDIVKHSKNIIDLIEVGDYVNGHLVDLVGKDVILVREGEVAFLESEIKSIVTKEQFNAIKYEIKED